MIQVGLDVTTIQPVISKYTLELGFLLPKTLTCLQFGASCRLSARQSPMSGENWVPSSDHAEPVRQTFVSFLGPDS